MENTYFEEAFKSLNLLNEEKFNLEDPEAVSSLADFMNAEDEETEKSDIEVVDMDSEPGSEEIPEIEFGDPILQCSICGELITGEYEVDEETQEAKLLDNQTCPRCENNSFKIVGKLCPFEEDPEYKVEVKDKYDLDAAMDAEEEPEETEESIKVKKLKEAKMRRALKKKLNEGLIGGAVAGGAIGSMIGHPIAGAIAGGAIGSGAFDNSNDELDESSNIRAKLARAKEKYGALDEGADEIKSKLAKANNRYHYDDEEISDYYPSDLVRGIPFRISARSDGALDEGLDKDKIKKWAKADFEQGQTLSSDDYREFTKICKDDGIKPSKELFNYYFDVLDDLRSNNSEELDEGLERIQLDTEDKIYTVSEEEKEPKSGAMIEPIGPEEESEFLNPAESEFEDEPTELDVSTEEDEAENSEEDETESSEEDETESSEEDETEIREENPDDFEESSFDKLGTEYLKEAYENVANFKTSNVVIEKNNLIIEGLIKFNSGKVKPTCFKFRSAEITPNKKVKFFGENLQISRGKKSFTLVGQLKGSKLISEALGYNYRAKNIDGTSHKVYGTVKNK